MVHTKQGLIKLLRINYRVNGFPCWSQVALKKLKGEPLITLRNESMFNNTRVITINDISVFIKMMEKNFEEKLVEPNACYNIFVHFTLHKSLIDIIKRISKPSTILNDPITLGILVKKQLLCSTIFA